MSNFDKAEAIEDLYHCHDKRELAKMVIEQRGEISRTDRLLRASVRDEFKSATSPIGAAQNEIATLEQELANCRRMWGLKTPSPDMEPLVMEDLSSSVMKDSNRIQGK